MLGGIPNSLAALIGKVIGKVTGQEVKADVKGMKADKLDPKSEKGAPLGDPGGHLLHGVGYAIKDARSQLKNKAEESNVNRFLEAQQDPKDPTAKLKTGEGESAIADKREPETADRKTEAQESREARDKDVRREDQKDDVKLHGRQETKEQEREQKDGRERERRQDREEHDDEEKHGHGWILEQADEEEEAPRRTGLRSEEGVYTDNHRCKGTQEDGTRCLRKPLKGIGYCREHAMNWRPDLTPKA